MKVIFLGRLADLAGTPERELAAPLDWHALLAALPSSLAEAARGDRVRVAINGRVLPEKTALAAQDGDEVALLPPVSGG